MFSLYYCFPSKLNECYKSEQCCQDSWVWFVVLQVRHAEIWGCFTKAVLIPQCFCLSIWFICKGFFAFFNWRIAERCALNKYKSGIFSHGKKNQKQQHVCLFFHLQKDMLYELKTFHFVCLVAVTVLQPQQHNLTNWRCAVSFSLLCESQENWGSGSNYTTSMLQVCYFWESFW